MLSQVESGRRMKTSCVLCWMHGNQELAHSFKYSQIRGVPHDVLDDVDVQRTDGRGDFSEPFALSFLQMADGCENE